MKIPGLNLEESQVIRWSMRIHGGLAMSSCAIQWLRGPRGTTGQEAGLFSSDVS